MQTTSNTPIPSKNKTKQNTHKPEEIWPVYYDKISFILNFLGFRSLERWCSK